MGSNYVPGQVRAWPAVYDVASRSGPTQSQPAAVRGHRTRASMTFLSIDFNDGGKEVASEML